MILVIPAHNLASVKRIIDWIYQFINTDNIQIQLISCIPNSALTAEEVLGVEDLLCKEAETHMVFILEYIINTYALVADHTISKKPLSDVVNNIVLQRYKGVVVLDGWGGHQTRFEGSDAEQLLKVTDIPLLILPENICNTPFTQVLLVSDTNLDSLEKALDFILELCPLIEKEEQPIDPEYQYVLPKNIRYLQLNETTGFNDVFGLEVNNSSCFTVLNIQNQTWFFELLETFNSENLKRITLPPLLIL